MVSVKLLQPVEHDGEDLVRGDIIHNLDEKGAARLIRFGLAERYAGPPPASIPPAPPADTTPPPNDGAESGDESSDGNQEGGDATPDGGGVHTPTPEEIAEIMKMTKNELLKALYDADEKASPAETKEALREKLQRAWTAPVGA